MRVHGSKWRTAAAASVAASSAVPAGIVTLMLPPTLDWRSAEVGSAACTMWNLGFRVWGFRVWG